MGIELRCTTCPALICICPIRFAYGGVNMGLFNVEVSISNFERPERRITLDALVNENRFFSILPLSMLRDLEVTPSGQQNIRFADGVVRSMNIGLVRVQIDDREAPTQVMFGEEDAQPLLGRLTLNGLMLVVDPVEERLAPMDIINA